MVIENERDVIVEDQTDRQAFYLFVSSIVTYISNEEYARLSTDNEPENTIAWFQCSEGETPHSLGKIEVFLNLDKFTPFRQNHELLERLQQVVVRHEAAELWYTSGIDSGMTYDKDISIANGYPHKMALLEEWRLAFELECEREYMVCIKFWAQEIAQTHGYETASEFLGENELAFQIITDEFFETNGW